MDVQGHRGCRGHLPENTLPAFARALELGVNTLELDVAVTRDGVVVVHHDRGLNPAIARGPDGRWVTRATPINHDRTTQVPSARTRPWQQRTKTSWHRSSASALSMSRERR